MCQRLCQVKVLLSLKEMQFLDCDLGVAHPLSTPVMVSALEGVVSPAEACFLKASWSACCSWGGGSAGVTM